MAADIIDRLKDKTVIEEKTGCWLWMGSDDGIKGKGYGRIRFNFKKIATHRISAHLFLGLDLKNKTQQALHKLICPNKNCWNPDHLYIGTHQDNVRDTIISSVLFTRNTKNSKNKKSNE